VDSAEVKPVSATVGDPLGCGERVLTTDQVNAIRGGLVINPLQVQAIAVRTWADWCILKDGVIVQKGDEVFTPYDCRWHPVLEEWIGTPNLTYPLGFPVRRRIDARPPVKTTKNGS